MQPWPGLENGDGQHVDNRDERGLRHRRHDDQHNQQRHGRARRHQGKPCCRNQVGSDEHESRGKAVGQSDCQRRGHDTHDMRETNHSGKNGMLMPSLANAVA